MTVVPTTESRPQTLNYLENLTWRLATGVGRLPEEIREIHAHYLKASQLEDGGFGGREDGSDLYYTSFALRGLAITGKLVGTVAESAASFLRGQFHGQTPVIDFLSLLYSAKILESSAVIDVLKDSQPDWQQHVVATLEACHREDGGYAKGPTSGRSRVPMGTFARHREARVLTPHKADIGRQALPSPAGDAPSRQPAPKISHYGTAGI